MIAAFIGIDVVRAERRVALRRVGLPLLDEVAVGRVVAGVGGPDDAASSCCRGLRAGRRALAPSTQRGPPHTARVPPSCCKPSPMRASPRVRRAMPDRNLRSCGCPVRSQNVRGQAVPVEVVQSGHGSAAIVQPRAQTAARPAAHRGRPAATARHGGPPRRSRPCPAPGCGWRAARWPAGGR